MVGLDGRGVICHDMDCKRLEFGRLGWLHSSMSYQAYCLFCLGGHGGLRCRPEHQGKALLGPLLSISGSLARG